MTDKFTIDDMEQAHMAGQADAGVDPSFSNAQAYTIELTRTQWKPQVGEVYAFKGDEDKYWCYSGHSGGNKFLTGPHQRSLTPDEVPGWLRDLDSLVMNIEALKVAIEGLRLIYKYNAKELIEITRLTPIETAQNALAKIEQMTGR